MFSSVHQQLCETVTITNTCHEKGGNQPIRTVQVEEGTLQHIEELSNFSIRGIARRVGVFHSTIRRIPNEECLFSFSVLD